MIALSSVSTQTDRHHYHRHYDRGESTASQAIPLFLNGVSRSDFSALCSLVPVTLRHQTLHIVCVQMTIISRAPLARVTAVGSFNCKELLKVDKSGHC